MGLCTCGQVPSHIILCFAFFSLILTSGGARQTGCWFVLPGLVRLSRGYSDSFLVSDWGVRVGYLGSTEMDDETAEFTIIYWLCNLE